MTSPVATLGLVGVHERPGIHLQPVRRIDLVAHLSGAFDLAEGQLIGHSARVAHLAHAFARRLRLDAAARRRVVYAALLHDAGVAVRALPDEVDHAGGHTAAGAWVASLMGLDAQVQQIVRCTHERWDGDGRPRRLVMSEIPVESLLISVAHWVVDILSPAEHPLRARAALRGVTVDDIEPLVGLRVAQAAVNELSADGVWMALCEDDLATLVAAETPGEGRPSHLHVDRVVSAIGRVVDAAVREPGRAERVAALASELGRSLGLEPAYCRALFAAGQLLDIGQLGVPRNITEKPAILSVEEMELMQRHPGTAARLIEAIPGFDQIARWVEAHHERPDGRGYPEQLTATELPLAARILAVADSFWALCAERPYRAAFTPDEAVGIIEHGAGQQYDVQIVSRLGAALTAMRRRPVIEVAA